MNKIIIKIVGFILEEGCDEAIIINIIFLKFIKFHVFEKLTEHIFRKIIKMLNLFNIMLMYSGRIDLVFVCFFLFN